MNIRGIPTTSFRRLGLVLIIACIIGARVLYTIYPHTSVNTQVRAITQLCAESDNKEDCVAENIARMIVKNHDVGAALRVIGALYVRDPSFDGQCSNVASAVAIKTYHLVPDFRSLRLGPESVYCNYGFVQSYAREMLLSSKKSGDAKDFCSYVASSLNATSPAASAECYRGAGQSLPFIDDASLGNPSRMIAFAIRSCEEMTSVPGELDLCVGGAFNYLDVRQANGEYGLSVEAADPTGICLEQKPAYREICYGNSKRTVLAAIKPGSESDFAAAMAQMTARYPHLAEPTLIMAARTLGYDQSLRSEPSPDYAGIAKQCAALSPAELRLSCVNGFELGLAKNGPPGLQYLQLRQFCAAITRVLGVETGARCPESSTVDYLKGIYTAGKFSDACKVLGIEKDQRCL
ncbi:hypothetical protein K8R03_03790 [Candidatus Kaiserbacteria bacterium]|nr:hypothetical protein [Candidatus Kaiserbacteria bacterium]